MFYKQIERGPAFRIWILKGVDKYGEGCVIKRDASCDSREVHGVLSPAF